MTTARLVLALFIASLGVRHTAYILLRGSIFERLRSSIKDLAGKYTSDVTYSARQYWRNYSGRRYKTKELRLRRRLTALARQLRYYGIAVRGWLLGKLDELFGCYICMTAQLSIWTVAVPTACILFTHYGNPVSVLLSAPASLIATVAIACLGTFLLSLATAGLAVAWWHAIDILETYRSDRLNAESAKREQAMNHDTKLHELTDLVNQLKQTVVGLQDTINAQGMTIPLPLAVPRITNPRNFVRTNGGRGYIFLDHYGDKISQTYSPNELNLNDLTRDYDRLACDYRFNDFRDHVIEEIKQAIEDNKSNVAMIPVPQADKQFTAQDAQSLVSALKSCDEITWCGFERRNCRERNTREFMSRWAANKGIVLNGVGEKVDRMMIDYYRQTNRGRRSVDIRQVHASHFPN